MQEQLLSDLLTIPDLLGEAHQLALNYLDTVDEAPVIPSTQPPPRRPLPDEPVGTQGALRVFADEWLPTMVASTGPRFQGFVTGGATPASVAGDWLVSAMDQNVASNEGGADALERQTIAWMSELLELPEVLQGGMVTGATMSNFTGLAIAREWLGVQAGVSVNEVGLHGLAGTRVLSGSAHSSVVKALSMLGLGRRALQTLPLVRGSEAVDVEALEAALAESRGPSIVVANAGTVNTGDFDDVPALLRLREKYGFWLHIDAAFGAFAVLDDRTRHLVAGIGEADSLALDLHKWMNVPYDAAISYTRHPDLQLRVFNNSSSYLAPPGSSPDFLHLMPENSRRLRALPAWLSLVAYGKEGHAEIVRRNNDNARYLAEQLDQIPGATVLAPVHLNIVCFTVAGSVPEFIEALQASGEAFLTPTTYFGQPAVRAAFSNWRTTPADVERIARQVSRILDDNE